MARQQFSPYQQHLNAQTGADQGGMYTGYQFYQGSQFQQAQRARVEPYTGSAYQCPHSQRALMAQFQDFSQRNFYDAAYLGCCDEPVQVFGLHPQYAEEFNPPQGKDCGQRPTEVPCYVPRLQQIGTLKRCGTDGGIYSTGKIMIECHQACREFASIPKNGGQWKGRYGTLTLIGTRGNQALLEYQLNQALGQEVWDYCLDNMTYTEYFCNQAVTFDLWGGLTSPEDCYCDCCGTNGGMSVPTLLMTAEFTPVGQTIWGNTFDFGDIEVTGACKGTEVHGAFYSFFTGDHASPSWSVGPTYDGDLRYLTGTLDGAGSDVAPICCGGIFNLYVGDPTCGTQYVIHDNYNFPSMITTPIQVDVDPVGTELSTGAIVLSDNNTYIFEAWPACAHNQSPTQWHPTLSVANKVWYNGGGTNYECSETIIGDIQYGDGSMAVEIETHIKDTAICKSCCGRAKMEVFARDGCKGTSPTKTYYIYGDVDPTNPWIGWRVFCQWDGSYYKEYKDKLFCDGSLEGAPSILSALNHESMATCIAGLNSNAPGLCGSGGHSNCTTCCHYALNSAGTEGKVVCALSTDCCTWEDPYGPYQDGSWIYGYWGICCSHTYNSD